MLLENETDFVAERYVLQDAEGRDRLVVVAKATYALDLQKGLCLADDQLPILEADDYFGDPETSGIRNSTDVSWGCSSTDIGLIGHAVAPDEKTSQLEVVLSVGKLKRRVAVFGDRSWKRVLGGWKLSKPAVFDRIPLTHEHAFGGSDLTHSDEKKHYQEQRNPLGVGAWVKKGAVKRSELSVPNLEDPEDLIKKPGDRPQPAGVGFVASHWEPRLSLAGTYDEAWIKDRMPLLPDDFDSKHNQAAHPSMIYDGCLAGDEEVFVSGVRADGGYAVQLPGKILECVVEMSNESVELLMNLSKLVIDADEKQILMTWRAELDVHGKLYDVQEIGVRYHQDGASSIETVE